METLSDIQVRQVSGGITSGEQIGIQSTLIAGGLTLAAAGFYLTPLGAFVFIGTSVAATASYIGENWNAGGGGTSVHYRSSVPAAQVKQN